MLKRFKYAIMLSLLPPLVYLFLILLRATLTVEHVNREAVDRLWQRGENIIACFWHGRLLAMPFAYRGSGAKVLISRHRDGEFIARVVRYFGLGAIRGSYRKEGSVSSIREMLAELKHGTDVALTPDGPKGPRYRMKHGIVELARLSQRPIVPVTYGATRKKVFNSWDRFLLPYPFSKILFLWGEPIYVSRQVQGDALEQKRREVEESLINLNDAVDRMTCGD